MSSMRRGRPRSLTVLFVLMVGLLLLTVVDRVITDYLWFRSLGFGFAYTTRGLTSLGLFLGFGAVTGLAVGAAMLIAYRSQPNEGPPDSEVLARVRGMLDHRGRAVAVPAVLVGLFGGLMAIPQTDTFLAWRHATKFGIHDAWFQRDIAFFVFELPWWNFVVGFLTTVAVLALIAAVLVQLTTGSMRFTAATVLRPGGLTRVRLERPRSWITARARAQLSIMIALILVLHAVSLVLQRYGYSVDAGSFTGVSYTDLHARIPAKMVMAGISLVVAASFVVSARMQRWRVATIGLVLMLVSSLLISGIYPSLLQRFSVRPNEQEREQPFVAAHLQATRDAYGLSGVEVSQYSAKSTASAGQLRADAAALPSIRLMDPAVIGDTFEQLQQTRRYYAFPPVLDVDRYRIGGATSDVVVSAREIDLTGVADPSWNNIHTVYTHGYGLVAAYGNRQMPNGEPVWLASGLPPTGVLPQPQPRIYFGELATQYVVVGAPPGADPIELDLPYGGPKGSELRTSYTGGGGVSVGNPLVRALYALRFGDANLVLSGRVNSASRILYDRQPRDRVRQVAPWLSVDSDTYPAVVDGRIVWIVDAYTTTSQYPNSQLTDLRSALSDSVTPPGAVPTSQRVNYVRNSVKATVDAYTGEVKLYAWDESEPLLRTWMKVYPGLVAPKATISPDLLAHLRYPQDQFKVQRDILQRYHVTDPLLWMQGIDQWAVPLDPTRASPGSGSGASAGQANAKEATYYLSVRWPGDSAAVFSQTTTMVPSGRNNLAAYIAVNSDATSSDFGKIRALEMSGDQVSGPTQAFNAMNQDQTVAEKLRPYLAQGAAQATYGNLLVLPVGGGILYVEPIYVKRQSQSQGTYPALSFVVVRFGEKVGIGDTLQGALDSVFGGDSGASTGEGGTPPTSGNAQIAALLAQAQAAFDAADAALKAGDLATYQHQIDIAKAKVAQAQELAQK